MERIAYLTIVAILCTACAVSSKQTSSQHIDDKNNSAAKVSQSESKLEIVLQDELLNEPPEKPLFIIAQPATIDAVEQAIAQSIRYQLLQLGYTEAQSRDAANVVVWYSYDSKQTGMRQVGNAQDVWGEQLAPVARADVNSIQPIAFSVQIISLQESVFPGQVIPVWKGEWSSSLPEMSMSTITKETLTQLFQQYRSEQTQSQIAAFQQARERKVKRVMDSYMKMVMYRIQKNWRKPKYKVKGKSCKVKIVQSAVGEIKSHKLLTCTKDRRFRKSIQKAIKASSPLPMPKEDVFDRRELILIFQG